jgi:hypothetical protein
LGKRRGHSEDSIYWDASIIARTRYLLLDFDGPICSMYG